MNHWLVHIRPDLRHGQARHEIGNVVAVHRRVMQLFPDGLGDTPRAKAGVLFRIDEDRHGAYILAQSAIPPQPDRLPARYGKTSTTILTPLLDALRPDLPVRYRITACAIKRISRTPKEGRQPGQVIPLTGDDAENWWQQRAHTAGLAIHSTSTHLLDAARGKRDTDPITISRHLFEGTATITDPDALREAITGGIGRGKPYGCGLLSLAPHQRP